MGWLFLKNQSYQTKAVKKMHNFNNFSFYIHLLAKNGSQSKTVMHL